MGRSRVAAIGIDAAEWSDVQQMVADGTLPHIGQLLSRSAVANLRGDLAYRAESSWTEFLTSRLAGENRYWTTAIFDPETYRTWEIGAHHGVPFYGRPDLKVVAFDIPHSTVSHEAKGAQIIAWGAHSPQHPTASVPADLIARIDARFGVHAAPLSDSHAGWHNEAYGRNLTDALVDGMKRKAEICTWLTTEEIPDWDVFCTVFSETHTAGHQFYHGTHDDHPLHDHPVAEHAARHWREVWMGLDESVGQLVKALDDEDTTILLFAVHGMRPNGSDITGLVLLPELFHRLEFGKPLIDFGPFDPAQPPVVPPPETTPSDWLLRRMTEPRAPMYGSRVAAAKNWVAWAARRSLPPSLAEGVETTWRRVKGAKAKVQWWEMRVRQPATPKVVLDEERLKPLDYHPAAWYYGYWPKMKAFLVPSFSDAHVRVNLKGRERDGVVPIEDYERVLDELEATINAVRDARTGRPVVEKVERMRTDDPFALDGPTGDLVVTFSEVSDAITHPDVGVVGPSPLLRPGEHSDIGWAAVRPPGGASGDLGTHRPRDLGPTIVDLLDRPPSPLSTGSSFAGALRQR